METLYDRIAITCKARGITPSGLCVKLGIRKAILSDLKSGRSGSMHSDTVVMFAEALGVTTDYILTGRELRLSIEESTLLSCWRRATDQEKQTIAFILREYGMPMPSSELQSEAV